MKTLADYTVLHDGVFDLEEGDTKEFVLNLPKDLANNPLILAYQARAFAFSGLQTKATLNISLDIQNDSLDTVTLRGDSIHGLWETFRRNQLSDIVNNVIEFKAKKGKIRISDVVLWYQRKA